MKNSLVIDDHCFACGKNNPLGLKLHIRQVATEMDKKLVQKAVCSFTLKKEYQGYGGIIHGGILATILDELMIYSLYYHEIPTVTAKMEIKFRAKIIAGESMEASAWMVHDRGKMVEATGEIRNAKGKVVVTAQGLLAKVKEVVRK